MRSLWITPVLLSLVTVAPATTTTSTDSLLTLQGTKDPLSIEAPTGTYQSVTTTIIVSTSNSATETGSGTASGTGKTASLTGNVTDAMASTTSASVTLLVGGQGTAPNETTNGTAASATSSSALPTNTQPCNGYVEFCARNYSNITVVAAHNSPFVRPGSFAANQQYPVTTQLNDGIRMRRFWPVEGLK